MTRIACRAAAASALAIFAAGTAMADLTADQVWADWQGMIAEAGQTLSVGSESRSGDTLTLRDVSIIADMAQGGINATIPEIVLAERGDGAVAITVSPEIPLDLTVTPAEGGQGNMAMLIRSTDLATVASGTPGAISYDMAAPAVSIALSEFMTDGEAVDMTFDIALAGLAGRYAVTAGDVRTIDNDFTADTMTVKLAGTDPEGSGDTFNADITVNALASTSTGTLSTLAAMSGDLGTLLEAGFTSRGQMTHGPMAYAFSTNTEGTLANLVGKADSGTFDFALSRDGLSYGGSNTGLAVSISSSDVPLPDLGFAARESAGRITMPVVASETPQDIGLSMRLIGLTIGDSLWSMFDPAGMLPRDPATLVIDLAGKANWLVNVFDPELDVEGLDGPPGQLHEVNVNELRLSMLGAELTGDGAFTFDNSVVDSLNAMPAAEGTLNLQLVGGNGLIDRLVMMGLLPEDQASGARMILGLFARPGAGPDTLVSEITVQPDGAVLANGQRVR